MPMLEVECEMGIWDGVVDELDTSVVVGGLCDGLLYFKELHFSDIAIFLFLPIEGLSFTYWYFLWREVFAYLPFLQKIYFLFV